MEDMFEPTNSAFKHSSEAECLNPTYRPTMEDVHIIVDQFCDNPHQAFFAVYDGHGGIVKNYYIVGSEIAHYVGEHFHTNLAKNIKKNKDLSIENNLKLTFLETDIMSRNQVYGQSGATAVCLFLHEGEKGQRTLYSANIGDARAVICKAGKAIRLSFDHKAGDENEKTRIENLGGFVRNGRVMGILAVARSFGDHGLKAYVTADPFINSIKITKDCEFIIVACDGLWDVVEDQAAVDFVKRKLEEKEKPTHIAQLLVDEAIAQGSQDNVTVLVIFL